MLYCPGDAFTCNIQALGPVYHIQQNRGTKSAKKVGGNPPFLFLYFPSFPGKNTRVLELRAAPTVYKEGGNPVMSHDHKQPFQEEHEAAAPAETRSGEAYYHVLARAHIAEPYDSGSLRPLRRQIRRDLRILRRKYEEILGSPTGRLPVQRRVAGGQLPSSLSGRRGPAGRSEIRGPSAL